MPKSVFQVIYAAHFFLVFQLSKLLPILMRSSTNESIMTIYVVSFTYFFMKVFLLQHRSSTMWFPLKREVDPVAALEPVPAQRNVFSLASSRMVNSFVAGSGNLEGLICTTSCQVK